MSALETTATTGGEAGAVRISRAVDVLFDALQEHLKDKDVINREIFERSRCHPLRV